MAGKLQPALPRFWAAVKKSEGCWEWQHSGNGKGYGYFCFNGRLTKAHRAAYALLVGPIPPGMWVLHNCDNPKCVRPDHLFLGTNADNVADKMTKRRHRTASGVKNGAAKLNPDAVRDIWRLRTQGLTLAQIAPRFGVSYGTIGSVLRGELWGHVQG